MRPGDTYKRRFYVADASTGAAVTGLVSGDFALAGWVAGSSVTVSISSFTELGSGWYMIGWATDSTAGIHEYELTSAGNAVYPPRTSPFELEVYDIDALAAKSFVPAGPFLPSANSTVDDLLLRLFQGDYAEVEIPCYDANGDAVAYGDLVNWTFAVKDSDGANQWTATTIANGPNNFPMVTIPEDASFYALLAAGDESVSLWWSIAGDNAVATKTATRRAGRLTVRRKET